MGCKPEFLYDRYGVHRFVYLQWAVHTRDNAPAQTDSAQTDSVQKDSAPPVKRMHVKTQSSAVPFLAHPVDARAMPDFALVSTFFSAIAAAVLVKSIDESNTRLGAVVNAMLFSAVFCSSGAAVYAVIAAVMGRGAE
jgi:hypothetical protein